MNSLIYANGDSFTWGTGIGNLTAQPQFHWDKFNKARLSNTWPGMLAKLMDCKFVNDGWAGGSNARIVRRTKKFVNERKDCSDVTVIIGWSTAVRVEYARPTEDVDQVVPYRFQGRTGPYDVDKGTTYVQIQESGLNSPRDPYHPPDKEYQKKFYLENSDNDLFVQYLQEVTDLQQFLQEHKVKYVMFNAFGNKELYKENFEDRRIYPILDKMNFDTFMGWPEEDFCVWAYMQDPNDKLPDGHLGVASHNHLSVLLYDKLKELYE
jgi:hypothetical protein